MTSNSIMSTPAASAASNDALVFPGAMWSAPLWPTRRRARVALTSPASALASGAPERRAVVVALAAGAQRRPAARARLAGLAVDDLVVGLLARPRRVPHPRADLRD